MQPDQFADLDGLLPRCRSPRAKAMIDEAVRAYRTGAFRASIVSTWIAVVFDFLDKLRELDLAGDARAGKMLAEFEKIREDAKRTGNLSGALAFESSVPDKAMTEFEFLSPVEHADLVRLREDRHRCAHPSMTLDDDPYQPPAELAHLHLRNAVDHMLGQLPVQGKAALQRLIDEVDSEYFPVKIEDAVTRLGESPLRRPRASLVRNLVIVLLKRVLQEDDTRRREVRHLVALQAVRRLHMDEAAQTLRDRLPEIAADLGDHRLGAAIRLLAACGGTWDYLAPGMQTKLRNFVEAMPPDAVSTTLPSALRVPGLHDAALQRLRRMKADEVAALLTVLPRHPPEVVSHAVALYGSSASFKSANERAFELVYPVVRELVREDIVAVLRAYRDNVDVRESFEFRTVLEWLRAAERIPRAEFEQLLREHGVPNADQQLPPVVPPAPEANG